MGELPLVAAEAIVGGAAVCEAHSLLMLRLRVGGRRSAGRN
jgi:hypothetical protein